MALVFNAGMNSDDAVYGFISRLLVVEGGFVNHPDDKGGPTNMGITQATLSRWRNKPVSVGDVSNLGDLEARDIYHELYWFRPRLSTLRLDPIVAEMLFDAAVHSGPRRAIKFLQEAIGVRADGAIGPVTRDRAAVFKQPELAAGIMVKRMEYVGRIITKSPSQAVFAAGWMHRLAGLVHKIPLVKEI